MSIKETPGGIVATGAGVTVFALLSQKMQLKLESKGLKSSGGALRPRLAASLGLKPRDSYETFIARIEEKLAELKPVVAAENGDHK